MDVDAIFAGVLFALSGVHAGLAVKNRLGFNAGAAVFLFGTALVILVRDVMP